MPRKLGLIAGGGILPRRLYESACYSGRDVFILALQEQAHPDWLHNLPHHWVRLGAVGEAIEQLKANGCQDVVMAGQVKRPGLLELRPDWRGARLLARTGAGLLGDDGLLRAIRQELESEGFTVLGPQDVLGDLLMPAETLTQRVPTAEELQDIDRGLAILRHMGQLDIGQSVIVQQGLVLGVEAIEGTAALIQRCAAYARPGRGGVLVKISKPEQDKQLDTPAIGPDTIAQCQQAGLVGIALEAGGALLLEREQTLKRADAANLFITGLAPG